jgi:hypothetical protein
MGIVGDQVIAWEFGLEADFLVWQGITMAVQTGTLQAHRN